MVSVKPRGRRTRLDAQRRLLAEQYMPLARSLSKPWRRAWPKLRDEFLSAANLALVEAAESFDFERNVRFATFARRRIQGALRDVLRRMGDEVGHPLASGRFEKAAAVIAETDREPLRPWLRCSSRPVGHDMETVEEVEHWLHKLPPHYAAACRQIYVHGQSVPEAAEALGYTEMNVYRLHRKALSMLGSGRHDPRLAHA